MTPSLPELQRMASALNDERIRKHLVEWLGEIEERLKTERPADVADELGNADRTVRENYRRQEREGKPRYSDVGE